MSLSPSVALLRTQTDERLVALARQGHERAFDAIVERYRRPLLRACRRFLPEARAEDALQQALIQAWRGLQRGDDVRDLRAWLYRIAHNTALNTLRQSGYDHEELKESARGFVEGPDEEVQRRAVVRQTLAGLAALPERQREALLRMSVEGATQEEVARDLGLSEGAVRQLVFRARGALRAAATAVMPMPLAGWLAAGGGGTVAAGGAGATLAKVSAVALIAGGVAGAPLVFDHEGANGLRSAVAKRVAAADKPAAAASGSPVVATTNGEDVATQAAGDEDSTRDDEGRDKSKRKRSGKDKSRSRSGSGDSERDAEDSGDEDSGDDVSSGKGGRGSGKGSGGKPGNGKSRGKSGKGDGKSNSKSKSKSKSGGRGDGADRIKKPRHLAQDVDSGSDGSGSGGSEGSGTGGSGGDGSGSGDEDSSAGEPTPEPTPTATPEPDEDSDDTGKAGGKLLNG